WHSRFDQPDPADDSYQGSDPQSFNRYAYVKNDPANFIDPSGLVPCLNVETGKWEDCPGNPERIVINTKDHLTDILFALNSRFAALTGGIGGGCHPKEDPNKCPPSGEQLKADPRVVAAIEKAWRDSKPGMGKNVRHEQGGWLYARNGQIFAVRGPRGGP